MRVDEDSANDIRETAGLVLNIAAVIAFVLSVNSFGTGNPGAAAVIGTAAAVAFLASLLCFAGEEAPEVTADPASMAVAVTLRPAAGGLDRKARIA